MKDEMVDKYSNAQQLAIARLHGEVENFMRFRDSIDERVRVECRKKKKPYKGVKSWPEGLRKWCKGKQTELVKFMRSMGLCRKHMKNAVMVYEINRRRNPYP